MNSFAYYIPSLSNVEILSFHGLSTPGYLWKVYRKIYVPEFAEEPMKAAKKAWFRTRQANFTIHVLRDPSYTLPIWQRFFTQSPVIDNLDEEQRIDLQAGADKVNGMNTEESEVFAEKYRIHILK